MTTTISVMSTLLADEDGVVTDLSGQVVADARERLQDLIDERPDDHADECDVAASGETAEAGADGSTSGGAS